MALQLFKRTEGGALYRADYPYKCGTRIWHENLGHGTVLDVNNGRLLIKFDDGDAVRIVAIFVIPCPTHAVSMTCH